MYDVLLRTSSLIPAAVVTMVGLQICVASFTWWGVGGEEMDRCPLLYGSLVRNG